MQHSNAVFTTRSMREGSIWQMKVIRCNKSTDLLHRRRRSGLTVLHRQNITTRWSLAISCRKNSW